MKYPELKGACKECLGCERIADPFFTGVDKCKWNKEVEIEQLKIGGKNEL